jgi:16S rRNA (adenine1518-N6/adenine1519-N6)-dimethyltransferase
MQKLGQHFLKNKSVLDTIVGALALEKNDHVIEIGPGHGELTVPLLEASEKLGCHVVSIEKDHSLIAELAALQEKVNGGRFEIIEGDVLKILSEVVSKKLEAYTIVGNIPYYITGKLLRVISELERKPKRTVLMIQEEVAERICAVPPEMNRLAASVQFWADASIIVNVPRKDFSPPPEVDSAVILLETKEWALKLPSSLNSAPYYRAVRGIFAQPRKTLLNNIVAMGDGSDANASGAEKKAKIADRLKKIGIDPEARPQDLSIEQIAAIAKDAMWG